MVAIVIGLLALSALASTLDSGVATPELLPKGSEGRVEAEEVKAALGPGWLAPIEVVLSGEGEPMTAPKRLRSLVAFQNRIAEEDGVQTVTGFNTVARNLEPLSGFERRLIAQQRGVTRLGNGIARTNDGAMRSSSGLSQAAEGASGVSSSVKEASAGAGLLAKGLKAANTGSDQLTNGLERASEGSGNFAESTSDASSGAKRLVEAIENALDEVDEVEGDVSSMKSAMNAGTERLGEVGPPLEAAEARLGAAAQALGQMTTGTTDPQYAAVQRALSEARELLSGKRLDSGELITPALRRGRGRGRRRPATSSTSGSTWRRKSARTTNGHARARKGWRRTPAASTAASSTSRRARRRWPTASQLSVKEGHARCRRPCSA